MSQFESIGLSPQLGRTIAGQGFIEPTPIQRLVVPKARSRDLVGLARTGTGKTDAYVWPAVEMLASESKGELHALVIVPTQELAIQVSSEFKKFGAPFGISTGYVIGGQKQHELDANLGKNILVATPGMLNAQVELGTIDLGRVKILILDEFDKLMDTGFLPQLRRIASKLPALQQRRNWLFSATMSPQVKAEAMKWVNNGLVLDADHSRSVDALRHFALVVPKNLRFAALCHLLRKPRESEACTIVFFDNIVESKVVADSLALQGIPTETLNGRMSHSQRVSVFESLRQSKVEILIASDIAHRGIDLDVDRVISYGLPRGAERYRHRSGRTARAGKSGSSILICSPEEEKQLASLLAQNGERFESLPCPPNLIEIPERTPWKTLLDPNLSIPEGQTVPLKNLSRTLDSIRLNSTTIVLAPSIEMMGGIGSSISPRRFRSLVNTSGKNAQASFDQALRIGIRIFVTDIRTLQVLKLPEDAIYIYAER